jgi:hypothetical protein
MTSDGEKTFVFFFFLALVALVTYLAITANDCYSEDGEHFYCNVCDTPNPGCN